MKKRDDKTTVFELEGVEEAAEPAPAAERRGPVQLPKVEMDEPETAPEAEPAPSLPSAPPPELKETKEVVISAPKVWIRERRDDSLFAQIKRWWVGITKPAKPGEPGPGSGEKND